MKYKYKEIKVGDVFTHLNDEQTVIYKSDKYRFITTINDDMTPISWSENELHLLKPLKEQLPKEGLLIHKDGAIVYRTGEHSGYGFASVNQSISRSHQSIYYFNKGRSFISDPKDWRKATKQEEIKFIKMLEVECKKHGLHENTKLEKYANGNVNHLINSGQWNMKNDMCNIYNKNGQIFDLGKFATPLKEEETKQKQITK